MGFQYQPVVCRDCHRHYVCTPSDDYYGGTTHRNGQCEACLLKSRNLEEMVHVELDALGRIKEVPRPGSGVN